MDVHGAGEEDTTIHELAASCTADDLEEGVGYLATVNGIVDYGIFVDLADGVSGLVHESAFEGLATDVDDLAVGDELVVRLEAIRDNGDLAFAPMDVDPGDVEPVPVAPTYDLSDADDVEPGDGTIHLEGELVQIKQTGGPTVLMVRDGTGVLPCTAFEAAGVRAYPDLEVGDLVHVTGRVELHEDDRQVEVASIEQLSGDRAEAVAERLEAALEARAAAHKVDPLVDWPALEPLLEELREVATLVRRTVLEGRPIRMRHHADGDGMCAAVPVALAVERFIDRVYEADDAGRHLLRRLPSKAPFYEMEDATRDLNRALADRARHGQRLPLVMMLDNGSTAEDVPAYETLAHYDIPIVAIDHHHPDPEAVEPLLTAHVNPYLHGEDYRITTGMLCVELARMIDPGVTDELRHLPAVAGLADRSAAAAMTDYLELAEAAGYDEAGLRDVSDALDYVAHWLRYSPGDRLLADVLNVDDAEPARHRELVTFLAERARRDVDRQLSAAMAHVERETLANDVTLARIDVERHVHRFTYPAPGTTTGAVHDRIVEASGAPAITVGHGPDFAVLRSDGVRLDIPRMVDELAEELPGAGVTGGGHLVVGSIKFVPGMHDEVLAALEAKMADAELDEELTSAAGGALGDD